MNRKEQIEVAVVLFSAILCLTGSFWQAILVGVFVLVACLLGFGRRWLLGGLFAIAIVAVAVVLGVPTRDQWLEWWQDVDPNGVRFVNVYERRGNCADEECTRQGLG
jgi:hypothetical protein